MVGGSIRHADGRQTSLLAVRRYPSPRQLATPELVVSWSGGYTVRGCVCLSLLNDTLSWCLHRGSAPVTPHCRDAGQSPRSCGSSATAGEVVGLCGSTPRSTDTHPACYQVTGRHPCQMPTPMLEAIDHGEVCLYLYVSLLSHHINNHCSCRGGCPPLTPRSRGELGLDLPRGNHYDAPSSGRHFVTIPLHSPLLALSASECQFWAISAVGRSN